MLAQAFTSRVAGSLRGPRYHHDRRETAERRGMAPKPSGGQKLKVLCLHGYAQNAEFFRQRTGSIRKNLKSTCEFHFLDVPHRPRTPG